MFRTGLDTNVVVSAAIKRHGMESAALDLVVAGKARLYVSAEILSEYEEELRRYRFKLLKKEVVDGIIRLIAARAVSVKAGIRVPVPTDDDDNRFLECAAAAKAHCLASGSSRRFPSVWRRTRVVTARQFVEILIDAERRQP